MASTNIVKSSILFGALRELELNHLKKTVDNICGIILFHQKRNDEEFKALIKEALAFGLYYGALEKKGQEYVIVQKPSNVSAEETPQAADNATDFCGKEVIMVEEEANGSVENKADKAKDTSEHKAGVDTEGNGQICDEEMDIIDVTAFSRDLIQLLSRYTRRRTGQQQGRRTGQQQGRRTGQQQGRRTGQQQGRRTGQQRGRRTGQQRGRRTGHQRGRRSHRGRRSRRSHRVGRSRR